MSPSPAFWRDRRVLLTGHTGFKGAWALMWLQHLGAKVSGVALAPEDGLEASLWTLLGRPLADDGFSDIRNPDAVRAAFDAAKPEIVIHLAAQALVHPSYEHPAETFSTNVMGLVNVLDAARASQTVRAVVNVTSDKCYENREQVWAYREDEPMGGSDPYSASKGCAELVTACYRRSFFDRAEGPFLASARAGNVIGGGDVSVDRLAPGCLRAFAVGEPVKVRNPLATRPWQHVLEPLSGYFLLAEALVQRGAAMAQGWNFGPSDEDAWPVARVVETLAAHWGGTRGWRADPAVRPKEAMLLRVDATQARVRLGWRPRLSIGEGLAWTVDWCKSVAGGDAPHDVTLRQIQDYEARSGTWP